MTDQGRNETLMIIMEVTSMTAQRNGTLQKNTGCGCRKGA